MTGPGARYGAAGRLAPFPAHPFMPDPALCVFWRSVGDGGGRQLCPAPRDDAVHTDAAAVGLLLVQPGQTLTMLWCGWRDEPERVADLLDAARRFSVSDCGRKLLVANLDRDSPLLGEVCRAQGWAQAAVRDTAESGRVWMCPAHAEHDW